MTVLHILRRPPDHRIREAIKDQSGSMGVTVVLIQKGVLFEGEIHGRVLNLDEDVKKAKISKGLPEIDYASMVKLIFEHDRIICW